MKKAILLLLCTALLTGCGVQETFETVDDAIVVEPVASVQQFFVQLPEEAAAPTFQDDSGTELYVCQGYTVSKQILPGGDLEKSVKTLTGKEKSELDVIKTLHENYDRYDFVWTAAGEDGLQLGRACILDDGNYHYTLSAMAQEEQSDSLRETFQEMFDSCKLLNPELELSIGS